MVGPGKTPEGLTEMKFGFTVMADTEPPLPAGMGTVCVRENCLVISAEQSQNSRGIGGMR
jgi:hypothetical protein